MKKLLLSITAAALLLTSCNGKKTEEHGHDHTDTHQHADGEAHESHEEQAVQQEFTVSKDTTSANGNHDHQHEAGEDHQH